MGASDRSPLQPQGSPPPYAGANSNSQHRPTNQPSMTVPNYTNNAPPTVVYVQAPPSQCARGGNHVSTTEFTLGGLLCALFFFPVGIICCLCLTERRCVKCNCRYD